MKKIALKKILIVCGALLLTISLHGVGVDDKERLVKQAMLFEAHANLVDMQRIRDELIHTYPNDPTGYLLKLNSSIGRFSWDINNTEFDSEIQNTAEHILLLAHESAEGGNAELLLASGQAYFALSYLKAIRGNYWQAGTNGSKGIRDLEKALALNPKLIDAKMHLGSANYFAANLPPFIKVFSDYVWFIPSGDEEKGLLLLEEVARSDSSLRIPAKYMLSSLLLRGSTGQKTRATSILEGLIAEFPKNSRFHLRQISQLAESARSVEALRTIRRFVTPSVCCLRSTNEIAFAHVWQSVALLNLGRINEAKDSLNKIPSKEISHFPNWGRIWYSLIAGKIYDKLGERHKAVKKYREVVAASENTLVPPHLVNAAIAGLEHPSPEVSPTVTTYE